MTNRLTGLQVMFRHPGTVGRGALLGNKADAAVTTTKVKLYFGAVEWAVVALGDHLAFQIGNDSLGTWAVLVLGRLDNFGNIAIHIQLRQ